MNELSGVQVEDELAADELPTGHAHAPVSPVEPLTTAEPSLLSRRCSSALMTNARLMN